MSEEGDKEEGGGSTTPKTKDIVKFGGGAGAILAAVMLVNSARDTFDTKMTTMQNSLDSAVASMGVEVVGLRSDVQGMAVAIAKVTTSLDTVSPKDIREEVVKLRDAISPRVDSNAARMDAIERRLDKIEARQNMMCEETPDAN